MGIIHTAQSFIKHPRRTLAELIDGGQRIIRHRMGFTDNALTPTIDVGTADYAFWDRARRGKVAGLEISGLLLKPIESKTSSWVMGRPPTFKFENKANTEFVNKWWRDNLSTILLAYQDCLGLGDSYLVVNADLSLTSISPQTVQPLVEEEDWSQIVGWRIRQAFLKPDEPERRMYKTDEYRPEGRTQRMTISGKPSTPPRFFPNRIGGRNSVIHIPNRKSQSEMFGAPEAEGLVYLLQRYGDVLLAALKGNVRQGRPTPTVEGLGDANAVKAFADRYSKTKTITKPDGTTETVTYVEWDADKLVYLGGQATFNYKGPSPFAGDTQILLGLLFYLYVQHSELPEWVLGNALQSSHASAETQVEPLIKFIEKKRAMIEGIIKEMIQVVLAYASIYTVGITVEEPTIVWEDMTRKDGSLTLSTIQWAYEKGLMDKQTALALSPVEVENIEEVIKKAEAEADERQDKFDDRMSRNIEQGRSNSERDELDQKRDQDADQKTLSVVDRDAA